MRKSTWTLALAGAMVACAAGTFALRSAWATAPSGFTSTNIVGPTLLGEFRTASNLDGHRVKMKTEGNTDFYVTDITITPGGHGGWHSHPGPSIIAIKSGEATLFDDCDGAQTPHVFPAGTAFVEDAECVHILRNEGTTDLNVIVIQLVPQGAPRRIDEQPPQ